MSSDTKNELRRKHGIEIGFATFAFNAGHGAIFLTSSPSGVATSGAASPQPLCIHGLWRDPLR